MSATPDNSIYLLAGVLGYLTPVFLGLFGAIMAIVFGITAMNMAKRRGLNHVPAFFAGFFGSFVALFFIAMFPKRD